MKLGDRVKIVKIPESNWLYNRVGEILGVAHELPGYNHYIVNMEEVMPNGFKALQITEHCLEPI
jgi:hypothetical protein